MSTGYRRSRHRPRKRAITPATVLMLIAAAGFLLFAVGTRFGLDIFGPHIAVALEEFRAWLVDPRWGS